MQAPGDKDEDTDRGFAHGAWTLPYWHGDIGKTFPRKFVLSTTLEKPIWRNTTIISSKDVESVRALKSQAGKNILTDGSSQLVHTLLAHDLVDELHLLLYPLTVGGGKRLLPAGVHTTFTMLSVTPIKAVQWDCTMLATRQPDKFHPPSRPE